MYATQFGLMFKIADANGPAFLKQKECCDKDVCDCICAMQGLFSIITYKN